MLNYKLSVFLLLSYFALIYSYEGTYIHLVLGHENDHSNGNDTNNNGTNNNGTNNNDTQLVDLLKRTRIDKNSPNFQFFPFRNNNITFHAKSEHNSTILMISLSLYPTRTDDQPSYMIIFNGDTIIFIKDGLIIDWRTVTTGISEEFSKFNLRIRSSTNSSDYHDLIVYNAVSGMNITRQIYWPFDLPYIGFGGELGLTYVMFDLSEITN